MEDTDLFSPCEFNGIRLRNRVVMSPLTRVRADMDGHVGPMQATYYAQRASAGLIISEATAIVPEGRGGGLIPGLWNDGHIPAWKQTTDAVHARGGTIFCQLWHAGRLSHSSLHPRGEPPVGPSATRQPGQVYSAMGFANYEEARPLTLDELPALIESFRVAARRAKEAGFDGVELHAAGSYLVDSFVRDMSNRRSDRYGGSIENRARLLTEVMAAIVHVWGPERSAIRLAPVGQSYGVWDSDPEPLFTHIVEQLNALEIGWLDVIEGDPTVSRVVEPSFDLQKLRGLFRGVYIGNNLYTRDLALRARRDNTADLVCFGRSFIGNPDLVERLRMNAPLVDAPRETYYGGGAEGYTDFPAMAVEFS